MRRAAGVILVVENNEDLREVLRELLEDAGFGVRCAADGVEALALLRSTAIALVLLDMHMPTMDGFEFRARQLAEPALAQIPVVVLTGDRHVALEGVEMMLKPFETEQLLQRVRSNVNREAAGASSG